MAWIGARNQLNASYVCLRLTICMGLNCELTAALAKIIVFAGICELDALLFPLKPL